GLIVLWGNQAHARRRAASNLIEQAGARAMGVDAVLAGAQAKDLLQDLDGFSHRPGIRIRTEEMALALRAAPVIDDARSRMGGDVQVGIGLVVPEQDVVAGL